MRKHREFHPSDGGSYFGKGNEDAWLESKTDDEKGAKLRHQQKPSRKRHRADTNATASRVPKAATRMRIYRFASPRQHKGYIPRVILHK